MKLHSENNENQPEKPEPEQSSNVRVQGVLVLVALEDGTVRQAHVNTPEHLRTILHICTMNEKGGLILGSTDLAPLLNDHINPEKEDDENPGTESDNS